jgi:hypothetical protein
MEMISVINQNKARKQETRRIENAKRQAKKERIYNVLVIAGYAVAFSIFVEIVCLIIK